MCSIFDWSQVGRERRAFGLQVSTMVNGCFYRQGDCRGAAPGKRKRDTVKQESGTVNDDDERPIIAEGTS